ncbi:dihydrofolate reductase family protein [Oceanobacillus sp. CFH 90083]|uniref:dihydrofolate reductase family protein n=1 Tax=Oceanobacillus sp. CFH 90083 TaxID=2592336 RepID=UPI00128AFCC7|nr:hypothetical protein [Oceanobacillus sp. CFH 90083]
MDAFWNNADERPESAAFKREYSRIWKETKKIVFSKTLQDVHTMNTVLVSHDIEETVHTYKNEEGKDIDLGGAGLANTSVKLNLIDEYRIAMRQQ